ncbi:cobalt ECF transporter T component CbiQ [Nocardioides marinquilinus]|uniref:Cobalt ECF transporter T component CbiQ n=1 Tax=Nocardioides marinquilinus TaxID=1210400 RepID=A0ABP9PZY6_9ACTN
MVHRAPAHLKVIALVAYAIAVVATPAGWWWAFAVHAAVLLGVIAASRVPPSHLARRMVVELPVVVFAVLLPFVADGPRTKVLGLTVSQAGLDGGLTLLVKATLGVLASLTLAATTEPQDLLRGLARLRVPSLLVQIMGFMVRYLEVVADDLRRMRIARESRGFVARGPRAWPVIARSLGALFIRSFERGERVHLAMLSRGYDGKLPPR